MKNAIFTGLLIAIAFQYTDCRSLCAISTNLRDRWLFIREPGTVLRIRRKSIVFKEPGREKLRYKCKERKGNTYLFRLRQSSSTQNAILCIGFAYISNHPTAEFSVVRLIKAAAVGHLLMSPLVVNSSSSISIDRNCKGADKSIYSYLVRTTPGCRFPGRLRNTWQTTMKIAWRMTFTKSDFLIKLMNGSSYLFRCEKRDKDFYLLRSGSIIHGIDGILCLGVKTLHNDPHYRFEVARLNSGGSHSIDEMMIQVPRGYPVFLHKDCDWIESSARPDYIYPA